MSIKISKNSHNCAACGLDFQHGQALTSTVKKADGALHREDFCKDCWRTELNQEAYSVWSVNYHDPKVESEEPPEVFSPLRQLFYEAAEEQSRLEMAKAFLAAGLLRRQKVFRLIKDSDDVDASVRVTLYADRIGNRLIEVPDPQFTYAELDTARLQLIERLQQLEAAAQAAAPAAENAAEAAKPAAEAAEAGLENSETEEHAAVASAEQPDAGLDEPEPALAQVAEEAEPGELEGEEMEITESDDLVVEDAAHAQA